MNALSDKQNQKLALLFFIGVLVGIFLFWMWEATQNALIQRSERGAASIENRSQTTAVENSNETTIQLQSSSIIVPNQRAGGSVVINKATLDEDGWVVIHEGTASYIGNALGAARFDKGEHSGVVELLRTTTPGNIYRAVLYRDNGDRMFSLDTDFPFLQDGNQPILTIFTAL